MSEQTEKNPMELLSVEKRLDQLEKFSRGKKVSSETNIPLLVAIIAAAAGLFGQAFVAWFNAKANITHENQRLQQQLLLNAVKANVDQSKKNLEFLLDTGLLKDSEAINTEKIRTELAKGKVLSIITEVEKISKIATKLLTAMP